MLHHASLQTNVLHVQSGAEVTATKAERAAIKESQHYTAEFGKAVQAWYQDRERECKERGNHEVDKMLGKTPTVNVRSLGRDVWHDACLDECFDFMGFHS
eukprot:2817124-Pyramimonas_sp.AAC.1